MNGLRAVNLDSLQKWRDHLPRLAEQCKRHPSMLQDLVRLGYEEDEQWAAILETVTPEIYPCRYPERRPYLKEWEKSLRLWIKARRYLARIEN